MRSFSVQLTTHMGFFPLKIVNTVTGCRKYLHVTASQCHPITKALFPLTNQGHVSPLRLHVQSSIFHYVMNWPSNLCNRLCPKKKEKAAMQNPYGMSEPPVFVLRPTRITEIVSSTFMPLRWTTVGMKAKNTNPWMPCNRTITLKIKAEEKRALHANKKPKC